MQYRHSPSDPALAPLPILPLILAIATLLAGCSEPTEHTPETTTTRTVSAYLTGCGAEELANVDPGCFFVTPKLRGPFSGPGAEDVIHIEPGGEDAYPDSLFSGNNGDLQLTINGTALPIEPHHDVYRLLGVCRAQGDSLRVLTMRSGTGSGSVPDYGAWAFDEQTAGAPPGQRIGLRRPLDHEFHFDCEEDESPLPAAWLDHRLNMVDLLDQRDDPRYTGIQTFKPCRCGYVDQQWIEDLAADWQALPIFDNPATQSPQPPDGWPDSGEPFHLQTAAQAPATMPRTALQPLLARAEKLAPEDVLQIKRWESSAFELITVDYDSMDYDAWHRLILVDKRQDKPTARVIYTGYLSSKAHAKAQPIAFITPTQAAISMCVPNCQSPGWITDDVMVDLATMEVHLRPREDEG